jgi:hypothetical protein
MMMNMNYWNPLWMSLLFPDIPAEIPGVLTARDEVVGVSNVIQEDPTQSDQERARLAAENSGMDFSSLLPQTLNGSHDVIEILDDDEDDAFYDHIKQENPVKVEAVDDAFMTDPASPNTQDVDRRRHSGRVRIANKQFSDYELYVTADEEEHTMLATVDEHTDDDGVDDDGLAAVAHYIIVHYAEKENLKKRKKKYKPKTGQFQLEAGIKRFGARGEVAVTKELEQFNTYGVFEPKSATDLTDEDKRKALASLIFLKEKRNGDIKARSCANGSVQREHIAKEEAAAPTVALESVFITSAIDAKENRKIVTIDIPGAFLHADNEDYVLMKMVGTLAELMVQTNPTLYRKYVVIEKGKSVLYLRLQKALYGMMKSALLFYRKLIAELRDMGFTINPYDPCIANKMVNGSQMTVRWHVDDLMISHAVHDDIMTFVQQIKDIYGENLTETVGTVHDYLGMTFDSSFTDEVRINMHQYISKVFKEFPAPITGKCATPATDNLYKIRDDAQKLGEEQADAFHHTVYQLLFAANRARRDIQTAVSFLTTCVKAPDQDDWNKLIRVLCYLNGTRHLKLILSAASMNFSIHWYIDASHQVHEDCRGQIGSLMTFGKGAVTSSSNKMKCNTKSSTETEIIALGDKLSDVLWTRYFVECQGYNIDECIIFQDNMSALSLEKNGRVSSSKRTKHIKAKYFLIKDYYNAGEIDLRYCPTDSMWADVLTKPLQGQKFRDMRAFLQNCSRNYDDDFEREEDERGRARHSMKDSAIPHPSSRECVEDRPRQPGPRQPAPPQQHQLRDLG